MGMTVLLRLTEWLDDQEYGLEKRFTTEMVDQSNFDILKTEYELMKTVIEKDLENARRKRKDTRWP